MDVLAALGFATPGLRAVFLGLSVVWIGVELGLLAREGVHLVAPGDRASALAIIASVGLASNLGLLSALLGWGAMPGSGGRWLGLGLMAGGIVFRLWALATLGRFFTATVRTQVGQGVIRHGPYRLLRHPSYTGTLLTLAGFGLALGTGVGTVLLLAIPAPAYLYRMQVEERALLAAWDGAYATYMQQSWRLIPWVW
ncbi:MAG TPA: isoprenylcysteine carboxylmethyltransferase family protein [Chloroflexia bacterium]|nr:isoprenylcysteine carboxylmethyltransferase family protein [Chloroflexia bacterium]